MKSMPEVTLTEVPAPTAEPVKGFVAEIFVGPHGDCSNEGLSSKVKRVTVVGNGADGQPVPALSEPTDEAPAVRVNVRWFGAERVVTLEPVEETDLGTTGYLAGGTYVGSADSRWKQITGSDLPLSLHDRVETWSQYAALSV